MKNILLKILFSDIIFSDFFIFKEQLKKNNKYIYLIRIKFRDHLK